MSSSKLAHDIVADIIDELSSRNGIGNELDVIDTDIQEELLKTLEDIVDNQLGKYAWGIVTLLEPDEK